MLRLLPATAFLLLIGPVAAGLAGAALPAFGFLPGLDRRLAGPAPFADLAAMPGLGRSVLLSLGTGLAATFLAFAVVVLFVAGWRGTRVFAAVRRLVSPLLSVPHAAAAFGLAFLIAPSGLLARLVSPWLTGWERPPDLLLPQDRLGIAMIAGLVVKEIPFLLLMTLAALPQIRAHERCELMAGLGYGRVLGFVHGVLPLLYRQIRLPVFAVLAYATSVVDMAVILGPTTPAPLAVRLLGWHGDGDLAMRFVAAAAAVLQLAVTAAAFLLWLAGERLVRRLWRAVAATGWRGRDDGPARGAGLVLTVSAAAVVLLGIGALALWSVAGPWPFPQPVPDGLSGDVWLRAWPALAAPVGNALLLGAGAAALALALALGALEYEARTGVTPGSRALLALYLPLVVPQIAFLPGLDLLFVGLRVDGTFGAVLLAHLVFVFPYVLLSLAGPWRAFDRRYVHMARALGRSAAFVFWRIRLPMLLAPVLTALAVGCAVSVGLYLPTLIVGGGRWPTVTTEAVALASGGDRRTIGAAALAQALLPFLGFALAALVPALLFRRRRALRVR